MFPVETKIPEIKAALSDKKYVVLTAPPGSGKTTVVPISLLNESWLKGKKIIMLEPRRLAARSCASFMANKIGENVGETVGYQVRLEKKISSKTRLEILTEGLLTQRLMSDPELSDVGLIIFDEFHERSLACDLAFALTIDVCRALRDDLRVLVMSATLDVNEVAKHLGNNVATIEAEGRMYPVSTQYLGEAAITSAVAKALRETDGDILCFLPGEGEIHRAYDALLSSVKSNDVEVFTLYGALAKEKQDSIFLQSEKRKVILATSIAETSLTIPNIACVIDSGLMRIPKFSASTGMSALVTVPLSLDRAEQRRGRAGRVRNGVCYRLWDEALNATRAKKMSPEIFDADLSSLVLTSFSWGACTREGLPWLSSPPDANWTRAVKLLQLLGALDESQRLTEKGKKMSQMPMHPRLANMLMIANENAAILAAHIEEGTRARETDIRTREATSRVKELAKRFSRLTTGTKEMSEGAALALAYPDRIARNRGNGSFRMVSGRGAYLEEGDALAKEKFIVCCQLDDRKGDAKVFLACPILEEEIVELFSDQIREIAICEWDRALERVRAVIEKRLGEMAIAEKPLLDSDNFASEITSAMMDGIRQKGLSNLPCWNKESRAMKDRISFLNKAIGEAWPKLTDEEIFSFLPNFIAGMTRLSDIAKLDMCQVFDAMLADVSLSRRELDRLAPTKMEVPSGSNMTIHYDGDAPRVEARLQECFGLMKTPKVANDRVAIVMTLLSPAFRPVQITKDLANFWREGYQLVRKDLRGRYPKHYWPEDPFSAVATRRVRPK